MLKSSRIAQASVAIITLFWSLTAALAADDRYVTINSNTGWVVSYDKTEETCIAVPKAPEGLFLIRPNASKLRLIFATPRLSWLQDAKSYEVLIFTDGGRWNGTMNGFKTDQGAGLIVDDPNERFLGALRSSKRMRIQVQGVIVGPYSLSGSSQTISMLSGCIAMKEAGRFKPAEPQQLPFRQEIEWTSADYGKTFAGEGWTAQLNGQKNLDETYSAYLKVAFNGGSENTLKLETTENGSGQVAVMPLDGGQPSLLFSSFTGGAHCCTNVIAAVAKGTSVQSIEVGTFDGSGPSAEDIDHDGSYELLTRDQRFNYAFGSYADSYPPLQILRLSGTKILTVTAESKYQPLLRTELVRRLNQLGMSSDPMTTGGAAGLLASASLVGVYDAVKKTVPDELLKSIDDSYRTCDAPQCEPSKTYLSYDEAVTDRLKTWGYDLSSHFDPASLRELDKLVGSQYGEPGDGEGSCSMMPTTFTKKADDFSFGGYEMGCDFGTATMISGAVAAMC